MKLRALLPTIRTFEGDDGSPYLTRAGWGRLKLHVFHRGDADQDPHDHPWSFWTFPLTSYVEEVTIRLNSGEPAFAVPNVVRAFRLHHRPATHLHRVVGPWNGRVPMGLEVAEDLVRPGRIVTLVWTAQASRAWGFLKRRDGRSCWVPWRDYLLGGGKSAPCEPDDARGAA